MDIICTWPLSDSLLLIGTGSGLIAMPFSNDIDHRQLIDIDGIDGAVHTVHADAGLVFCIVGAERDVIICEQRELNSGCRLHVVLSHL